MSVTTDIAGYEYTDLQVVMCRHCAEHDDDMMYRTHDRQIITWDQALETDDWCWECDSHAKYWKADAE